MEAAKRAGATRSRMDCIMNGPRVQEPGSSWEERMRWLVFSRSVGGIGKGNAHADVAYGFTETADDEGDEDPCSCSGELVDV
jgi:hypothetical protein